MKVEFVKIASIEESLALLEKRKPNAKAIAVLLRPEFGACPKFLKYALLQAFKSFQQRTQVARMIELETLCNLALTKNVASAVEFTKPTGKEACVVLDKCLLPSALSTWKPTKEQLQRWQEWLAERYGITKKALANFSREDLLIETVAVERL